MNIKSLIKKLEKLDPNTEIILASDAEGNSYHRLDQLSQFKELKFIFDKFTGEFQSFDSVEEAMESDYSSQQYDGMKTCIILYPK